MLKTDAKTALTGSAVKKLIDELEREFKSLRKAAKALGTSHTRLMNWRDGQQSEFISFLEKIRKALKIPEDEFWKMVRGKEKS